MSALAVSIAIVRGSLPSVSRAPRSAPRFRNRQASLERIAKFSCSHPPTSLPESFLPIVPFPQLPTLCGPEWWHGGVGPGQHCLLGSHSPHFGGETRRPEENSARRDQEGDNIFRGGFLDVLGWCNQDNKSVVFRVQGGVRLGPRSLYAHILNLSRSWGDVSATLPKESNSVPSTHTVIHNCL